MRAASAEDFASWREQARTLLAQGVGPEQVAWHHEAAPSLFAGDPTPRAPGAPGASSARVPRELVELLEAAACHRDPARWSVMYRVLWRVARGGRALLDDPADPDLGRLRAWARAVDREVHHMHAFVRFRETTDADGQPLYAAWFEPEHDVVARAAPFFRDRFASMRWIIATPRGAVRWDGRALEAVAGPLEDPRLEDGNEALWRTYYASVFNPARLNPGLMRQHVPKRYWRNMPEIHDAGALSRRGPVLAPPVPEAPRWAARVRFQAAEAEGLQACRRCPLWQRATQAVPGEGPAGAALMLVGEQPGDEEDLQGRPFVGPAGHVLERALATAGIARGETYVTNAVKHFKWEPRGKRRLHKTPAQREVEACGTWLEAEIAQVSPRVIVALGATACLALTGRRAAIASSRGDTLQAHGAALVVTYHPSAVLRADDRGEALFALLVEDLARAARLAGGAPL